jgi:hypothetical protein
LGCHEFGREGGAELEAAVGLVVGRGDIEVDEKVGELGFGAVREGGTQVGDCVEHRLDFVGAGAHRALDFQGSDRFGDRFPACAEFLDASCGERDDRVGGVVVLLEALGLAVSDDGGPPVAQAPRGLDDVGRDGSAARQA